jgi:hypothetical protein
MSAESSEPGVAPRNDCLALWRATRCILTRARAMCPEAQQNPGHARAYGVQDVRTTRRIPSACPPFRVPARTVRIDLRTS